VGPTCQTPRAAPGLPGSVPLPRGCHVPRRSNTLKALSGPRAVVPTAPFRPAVRKSPPRYRCCLASPVSIVLIPTVPPPGPKPTIAVRAPRPSLSGRLRRREHVHGERRPSSPLTVLHPWSVELTFPSLLAVAGPPPATIAPPRRKNTAAEPVFSP
jgi:hypothetical protein